MSVTTTTVAAAADAALCNSSSSIVVVVRLVSHRLNDFAAGLSKLLIKSGYFCLAAA